MDLGTIQEFDVTISKPFDFRLTTVKPAGWHWSVRAESFEDGTFRTAVRVGNTPVGLAMSARKNKVRILAFTHHTLGNDDSVALREIIRIGLGDDEDLAGFYTFARNDPVLSRAVADHPGMRIGLVDDIFGSVTLAILLQMAPINRSQQMMDAVLTLAGTEIRFDDHTITLWPRAEDIAFSILRSSEMRRNLGTGPNDSLPRRSTWHLIRFHSEISGRSRKKRP